MIADALTEAFVRAAVDKDASSETTIAQRKKALEKIEQIAARLTAQLGIMPTPVEWSGHPATRRKHRLLIKPLMSAAYCYDRDHTPAEEDGYSQKATEALDRLPEALSALQVVCTWAKDNVPATPFDEWYGGGDHSGDGQDHLFRYLAEIFFAMFGKPPNTGWRKDDQKTDSLLWINAVLQMAHDRVSDRILLDLPEPERATHCAESDIVRLVDYAYSLASSSRAKRLADAWKAWRSLDAEDRWSSEAWVSSGLADGSRVPEWLRSATVPVPRRRHSE